MKEHKEQYVESCLPLDLVGGILSRLPVKSLIRFRCVCKPWRFLIDDANFAKEQHIRASPALIYPYIIPDGWINFYDFDRPEYDIKERMPQWKFKELEACDTLSNSVNGLICGYDASRFYKKKYCLLNPSTRTLVQLPGTNLSERIHSVSVGLGFDVSTGKYKLVLLSHTHFSSRVCSCFVLTVGCDNKWRYVGDAPSLFPLWRPVYVEGVVNWIARLPRKGEKIVLAFHMKDEKLHIISTPKSEIFAGGMLLSNCNEHLWLSGRSEECLSIWKLEDYTSRKWTLEYQIDFPSGFSFVCFLAGLLSIKEDKLMLHSIHSSEPGLGNWLIYDTLRKSSKHLCASAFPLALYTESLVCPRKLFGLLKEVV